MESIAVPVTALDRVEKAGRVLLWLSIASACVIVPVAYISQRNAEKRAETKAEADLQEAVKRAETRAAELEKKSASRRVSFAAVETSYLSAIGYSNAQANLWFTNVSSRGGVVCLVATAREADSAKSTDSLPACQEVTPYAGVHMTLMFANGELTASCPHSNCSLTFNEAPEPKDEKAPTPK